MNLYDDLLSNWFNFNDYKNMITIHSPKFSTGKTEITKNSPTFRGKRAPSVTDSYSTESMPKITSESPAKLSADRKRKSHNDNVAATFTTKPLSK